MGKVCTFLLPMSNTAVLLFIPAVVFDTVSAVSGPGFFTIVEA